MRWFGVVLAVLLAGCAGESGPSAEAACAAEPTRWARGPDGCLAITSYGPARAEVLVVVLHGDVSAGGPANYHRALAERVSGALPAAAVVAMVRPGYPDGEGRTSAGNATGRSNHYTAANMALVAGAVSDLRTRTGARRVIAIGHSGGAATGANLLASHPGVVNDAVLLACPCDLVAWRSGRTPWSGSVNPIAGADRVPAGTRVLAYTGSADDNTVPALARDYVARLSARGVSARFTEVRGATHNGIVGAVWGTDFPASLAALAGR